MKADKTLTFESAPPCAPLRIAVLAHLHHPIMEPFAGGMESHTSHLVAGLTARGHRVTLFAKEGSEAPCHVEPVLAHQYRVDGYPDSDGQHQQHLRLDGAMAHAVEIIRSSDFDVVLNNSLSPVPQYGLVGVPTLHVLHTPVLPRLAEIFGNPGWQPDPAHRFVTVSHTNAAEWRQWLPTIEVVHNGVVLKTWDEEQTVEHGTAAWTGRITPEKGTHLAIAAARATNMKLRIAGPIQNPAYFSTLIEPELDDDITYLGHLEQPELAAIISAAQVFISSPMWEEPFGLTTLEAMACGTPVAALPAGAMREIITPQAGVVAATRDVSGLVSAIRAARDLDRGAVRRSAETFSLNAMLDAYETRLRSVLPVGHQEARQLP